MKTDSPVRGWSRMGFWLLGAFASAVVFRLGWEVGAKLWTFLTTL